MTLRTEGRLDETDWRIITELQRDGRISFNELGRRVSLSPPSVAERVRRLESLGVITGYRATVDPAQAGQPVAAFIQMRCDRDRCLLKTTRASDYPEIVEIHKLSGDYCSMVKVRASSMQHLESFIERIGQHGELRSSVVLSTQFEGRPVEPLVDDAHRVTRSTGWSSTD
ncbi:MAG: Lrp/AsnC family transcriptional regulator [Chloroflexota bacterium]|nr:Lrp/AsnC family transcriptional regulator [Chloroflexota bacterium]